MNTNFNIFHLIQKWHEHSDVRTSCLHDLNKNTWINCIIYSQLGVPHSAPPRLHLRKNEGLKIMIKNPYIKKSFQRNLKKCGSDVDIFLGPVYDVKKIFVDANRIIVPVWCIDWFSYFSTLSHYLISGIIIYVEGENSSDTVAKHCNSFEDVASLEVNDKRKEIDNN